MATVTEGDWDKKKVASVTDPGSTPTGIQKVQPVKVTWGNGSSSTGTGVDCEFKRPMFLRKMTWLLPRATHPLPDRTK